MLISEYVTIIWGKANKRIYTNKGYEFTNYGDKVLIRVGDLPIGSNTKIKVQCDYCDDLYEMTYKWYNKVLESDNPKLACKHCTYKKSSENNLKKYGVKSPTQTKEIMDKIKQSNILKYGVENPFQSELIKEKIKNTNLERYGVENPMQNEEISSKFKGSKSNLWRGGTSSERDKIKKSEEYKQWRQIVYKRDNYTCQCCGDNTGGNLHAHHIVNFSDNKYLRYDVDNGITLCSDCHNPSTYGSFHHTYGTKNNTREQLDEYIEWYREDVNRVFADLK